MRLCVPVKIKQPTLLTDEQQANLEEIQKSCLPRYNDSISLHLFCFRILVMFLCFIGICQAVFAKVFIIVFLQAVSFLASSISAFYTIFKEFEDKHMYLSSKDSNSNTFSWISALSFGVTVVSAVQSLYIFSAATTIGLLTDLFIWRDISNHYASLLEGSYDALLIHIKNIIGQRHELGTPIYMDFGEDEILEQKLWEGIPQPYPIHGSIEVVRSLNEDGQPAYFVTFEQYCTVSMNVEDYIEKLAGLVEQNNNYRWKVAKLNKYIDQMRKKIAGTRCSCADIEDLPIMPSPVEFWRPNIVKGLLVPDNDNIVTYVSSSDYLDVIIHIDKLKKNVQEFEDVNYTMKGEIVRRKMLVDDLLQKLLKDEEPYDPEDLQFRMDNVD